MRYTAQSFTKSQTPSVAIALPLSAQPSNTITHFRILTILLLLAAFFWTMMHVQPTHAAETCATRSCVLACSAAQKICSLFPTKAVPSGYGRVSYLPFGYRRVRQSSCDKMVCPTFSTTCRRWIPTGKNGNAIP